MPTLCVHKIKNRYKEQLRKLHFNSSHKNNITKPPTRNKKEEMIIRPFSILPKHIPLKQNHFLISNSICQPIHKTRYKNIAY